MAVTDYEIWDAKRIVNEYILLADSLEEAKGEYGRLAQIEQVKAQRLASAISACLDMELDPNDPLRVIGQVFNIYDNGNELYGGCHSISKTYPITEKRYDEALTMVQGYRT